jgi:protein associated with RNAse G/E
METKDKTLFVPAPSICYHHTSLAFKCSCIWKFFGVKFFCAYITTRSCK